MHAKIMESLVFIIKESFAPFSKNCIHNEKNELGQWKYEEELSRQEYWIIFRTASLQWLDNRFSSRSSRWREDREIFVNFLSAA